ncbi:MAG: 50S ribosome-binding GTPase [Ignavibacteriales bacterium]|nr:50S ribosome-binding GTPase [Ignavibacteriales bacterium]
MLREERVLVSAMPGTTRDAIDTELQWRKRRFRIVDTAGIRRPGQRGALRRGRARQRHAGEAGDRAGRSRGARARRGGGRHRPGRRDRRGRRQGRARPHHRREQVGPREGGRRRRPRGSSTTNWRGR